MSWQSSANLCPLPKAHLKPSKHQFVNDSLDGFSKCQTGSGALVQGLSCANAAATAQCSSETTLCHYVDTTAIILATDAKTHSLYSVASNSGKTIEEGDALGAQSRWHIGIQCCQDLLPLVSWTEMDQKDGFIVKLMAMHDQVCNVDVATFSCLLPSYAFINKSALNHQQLGFVQVRVVIPLKQFTAGVTCEGYFWYLQ
eukprot:GHRR01022452.1.p1 GENE.GHRR01022452.1~~GHRR01022452.1.p1  ORF type:complete len:199 (+),score=25.18 GHRR01022452.1:165-761(+)